mgnify:CR=1 FL=1
MSLIRYKKYQYLYLRTLLQLDFERLQLNYEQGYDKRELLEEEQRIDRYESWLDKINVKYGYDKNQKKATIYQEALRDMEYQQALKERKCTQIAK